MANFTAADVKKLRELTGSGMKACKDALVETDGDFDKAVEILRIKGAKDVGKRAERTAAEGLIAVSGNTMVEVNSETDFVAKADPFIAFGEKVMDAAVAGDVADLDTLLATEIDGQKVSDLVTETGALLGEKVVVRRIARVEGQNVDLYLHRTSKDLPAQVGVLPRVLLEVIEPASAALVGLVGR